jgi:hypothetical protein
MFDVVLVEPSGKDNKVNSQIHMAFGVPAPEDLIGFGGEPLAVKDSGTLHVIKHHAHNQINCKRAEVGPSLDV